MQLALSDVTTDHSLEALHYNKCRCHGTVVTQITDYGLFGSGIITEDGGTVDWDRGRLKILVRHQPIGPCSPSAAVKERHQGMQPSLDSPIL